MSEKNSKRSKVSKFLLGAIIGSAVGSIVGLTFAPKSGREMRGQIAKESQKTWSKVRDIVEKKSKKEKKGFWHTLNSIFIKKNSDAEIED